MRETKDHIAAPARRTNPRAALCLAACVVLGFLAGGCGEEPKMTTVQGEGQFYYGVLRSAKPVLVEFFKAG